MALVLFGTDATKNPLEQDEQYQNIVVHRHLMVPDFELLEEIEHQIHPEGQQADCIFFLKKNLLIMFLLKWNMGYQVLSSLFFRALRPC